MTHIPMAWRVICKRVGMPERLARRTWRAIEASRSPGAGALRFHIGRVSYTAGIDEDAYWGAVDGALTACSPRRIVRILEDLAQAGTLPWTDANAAMEAFLQHADAAGEWALWRTTSLATE